MYIKDWNIEELTGYKPITNYYLDFSAMDLLGVEASRNAFIRVFDEAKQDYRKLTELTMVLNWKIYEFDMEGNSDEFKKLYIELWNSANSYAIKHLKGNELEYFYNTTE